MTCPILPLLFAYLFWSLFPAISNAGYVPPVGGVIWQMTLKPGTIQNDFLLVEVQAENLQATYDRVLLDSGDNNERVKYAIYTPSHAPNVIANNNFEGHMIYYVVFTHGAIALHIPRTELEDLIKDPQEHSQAFVLNYKADFINAMNVLQNSNPWTAEDPYSGKQMEILSHVTLTEKGIQTMSQTIFPAAYSIIVNSLQDWMSNWRAEREYPSVNLPPPLQGFFSRTRQVKYTPFDAKRSSALSFTWVEGPQPSGLQAVVQLWVGTTAVQIQSKPALAAVEPYTIVNLIPSGNGAMLISDERWDPYSGGRWKISSDAYWPA